MSDCPFTRDDITRMHEEMRDGYAPMTLEDDQPVVSEARPEQPYRVKLDGGPVPYVRLMASDAEDAQIQAEIIYGGHAVSAQYWPNPL